MKINLIFLVLALLNTSCSNAQSKFKAPVSNLQRIDGLSFVAPPKSFEGNPMTEVVAINAEWIAVIPYAYTREGQASVIFNSRWQWWGEKEVGVRKTIEMAKQSGLKVMLKPQVYVPGSWTGNLDFDDKDWLKWEADYTKYLMTFVRIATELGVEMICIGTEFKIHEHKRAAFWYDMIQKIRQSYKGKLTYAANWDCFEQTPFWDALDFIGVNAYFPLDEDKTPSVAQLKQIWKGHKPKIEAIAKKYDKPVLFTEYGYLSTDYCAHKTWELEAKVKQLAINETAQANALQALYESFDEEPYWKGGFLWKWFPEMQGHEGYPERDYTPQGKEGAAIVKQFFGSD